MKSAPVSVRLSLVLLVTLCLSLAALGALNQLKFMSDLRSDQSSRTELVAEDLRGTVEDSVALGLPLEKLDNLRGVIAQGKAQTPGILDIAIVKFAAAGPKVAFDTATVRRDASDASAWTAAAKARMDGAFRIEGSGTLTVGLPIHSAFGTVIGEVVVIVSNLAIEAERAKSLKFVAIAALGVGLVAGLALLLASFALLGRFERRVAIWTAYARAVYESVRAGAPAPPTPAGTSDYDEVLGASLLREGHRELSASELARSAERSERAVRKIKNQFSGLFVAGLIVATLVLSLVIGDQFSRALLPDFLATGATVGHSIARDVARVDDLHFPLARVRGIQDALDRARARSRAISYLHLVDRSGRTVAVSGTAATAVSETSFEKPTLSAGGNAYDIALRAGTARLHVGVDAHIIARLVADSLYDVLTILVLVAIIAREVLAVFVDRALTVPLAGLAAWQARPLVLPRLPRGAADEVTLLLRNSHAAIVAFDERRRGSTAFPPIEEAIASHASAVTDSGVAAAADRLWFMRAVRFATFGFFLADAIPNSFVPVLARDTAVPIFGLPVAVIASLPVVVFWLLSGFALVPSTRLLARLNYRFAILGAMSVAIVADLVAASFANIFAFIAARAVFAIAFSLMFVAAQSAFQDFSGPGARTRGPGVFTGTVFLAAFCGTALGGVAATQIGFQATFVIAVLALCVMVVFVLTSVTAIPERQEERAAPATGERLRSLIATPRFAGLLFLCALPNRLANVAIGFYVAPLFLATLALTSSEIGRIVSLYALIMAVCTPIATRIVDRFNAPIPAVVLGTLLVGAGMLAVVMVPNAVTVTVAIACMGIGQAFSVPTQVYLAPWLAGESGRVLGSRVVTSIFRSIERTPAFAGPVLGSVVAARFGFVGSIGAYGACLTGCGLLLAGMYARDGLLRLGTQPDIATFGSAEIV